MQRSISYTTAAAGRGARVRRALRSLFRVLRGETGFPQVDVDNEFLCARRRAAVARLACRGRGRPANASRLVPLDEVAGALGRRGDRLRLQSIRLVTIRMRPGATAALRYLRCGRRVGLRGRHHGTCHLGVGLGG